MKLKQWTKFIWVVFKSCFITHYIQKYLQVTDKSEAVASVPYLPDTQKILANWIKYNLLLFVTFKFIEITVLSHLSHLWMNSILSHIFFCLPPHFKIFFYHSLSQWHTPSLSYRIQLIKKLTALAGVAQWMEHGTANQRS